MQSQVKLKKGDPKADIVTSSNQNNTVSGNHILLTDQEHKTDSYQQLPVNDSLELSINNRLPKNIMQLKVVKHHHSQISIGELTALRRQLIKKCDKLAEQIKWPFKENNLSSKKMFLDLAATTDENNYSKSRHTSKTNSVRQGVDVSLDIESSMLPEINIPQTDSLQEVIDFASSRQMSTQKEIQLNQLS